MTTNAFLFPGQGAQHVGMGQSLFKLSEKAKALFSSADEILGYSLSTLCFEGPKEELNQTVHAQPALYVCSLAALEILKEKEPQLVESCKMTAGLSLGEYTALTFASALSFEEGLQLVQKRGEAMQKAAETVSSGMVSLLLIDLPEVEQLCKEASSVGYLTIANYLCPGNTVVSGDTAACDRIVELCETGKGKSARLAVAGAFHSRVMQPATEELREALAQTTLKPPRIPVISNVDAQSHSNAEEIRNLLVQQVVQPVLWQTSMETMIQQGIEQFHEIGPGRVLKGLLRRINRKIPCENVNDSTWES